MLTTQLKAVTLINLLPRFLKMDLLKVLVSKYNFEENHILVMYKIDIKDALYFTVITVVVLEIFSKNACFIDSK